MTDLIDLRGFGAEVSAMADRLEALQQRAKEADGSVDTVVDDALVELQQTVEALRVSQEELSAQGEALLDSRRALEDEYDRYRALFLDAPVPFLVTDTRGIILEANRAAIELLNVDDRFVVNKPLVTFVVPAHRAAVRQRVLAIATHGQLSTGEWDVQPRRRPPIPATFQSALLRSRSAGDTLLWLLQDNSTVEALRVQTDRLASELSGPEDAPAADDPSVRFALDELLRTLLDEYEMDDAMTRVAETGRGIIPSAAGVSVSLFEQGRPRAVGTSAPWVESLDECQYGLQEGPCVAALADGVWHSSDNLDEEPRWPRFATEATGQGVLSVLSVPLLVRGARLGVLNIYASNRSAFDGAGLAIARRLADVASILLANTQVLAGAKRLAHELEQALISRATVDMAKGILMARLNVDPDTAFDALRDLSQRRHMKLRDLAAELVAAPGA